jgi:hypothetical protein
MKRIVRLGIVLSAAIIVLGVPVAAEAIYLSDTATMPNDFDCLKVDNSSPHDLQICNSMLDDARHYALKSAWISSSIIALVFVMIGWLLAGLSLLARRWLSRVR